MRTQLTVDFIGINGEISNHRPHFQPCDIFHQTNINKSGFMAISADIVKSNFSRGSFQATPRLTQLTIGETYTPLVNIDVNR